MHSKRVFANGEEQCTGTDLKHIFKVLRPVDNDKWSPPAHLFSEVVKKENWSNWIFGFVCLRFDELGIGNWVVEIKKDDPAWLPCLISAPMPGTKYTPFAYLGSSSLHDFLLQRPCTHQNLQRPSQSLLQPVENRRGDHGVQRDRGGLCVMFLAHL